MIGLGIDLFRFGGAAVLKSLWDVGINNAVYSGNSFSVAAKVANCRGMAFSNDGTNLFIADNNGREIDQYILSNAFDVTTASYLSSKSVIDQEPRPTSVAFNDTGTLMIIVGSDSQYLWGYTLSTPFVLSSASASYTSTKFIGNRNWFDVKFNNDGTVIYLVDGGTSAASIRQYPLSTPYAIGTMGAETRFILTAEGTFPTAVDFNADGTKMFILQSATSLKVVEYFLTTAFDIATAIYTAAFPISETTFSHGMSFNEDGTKLIIGAANDRILFEYIPA